MFLRNEGGTNILLWVFFEVRDPARVKDEAYKVEFMG
jgi:hypothetical protein